MMWLFHVQCDECGHLNTPRRGSKESILAVLKGEFHVCRRCGGTWTQIQMPLRPLVKKCIAEIGLSSVSSQVIFFDYSGAVPVALGLT